MEQCDVICMNRYWGWYVLGGELDKALAALEQELDARLGSGTSRSS